MFNRCISCIQSIPHILQRLVLISLIIIAPFAIAAQEQQSLSGTVIDRDTQKPLANVQISLIDRDQVTSTNAQGQFNITAPTMGDIRIGANLTGYMFEQKTLSDGDKSDSSKSLTLSLRKKIKSAATLRWEGYLEANSPKISFESQPGWSVTFRQHDLKGDLAPDREITRRDPSAVIKVKDTYYMWYSRGTGPVQGFKSGDPEAKVFPWDKCDIYLATSQDGITWKEQGPAVLRGPKGAYDDRSVFTPEILAHQGKYYLVYQAVKAPYIVRVKNTVGMAWSDSPEGPWTKLDRPILEATHNGVWTPDSDSNHDALVQGDFDSHKVHDPTLLIFNDQFYLYYKGERMGEKRIFGQREIKWGVATSKNPLGPYVKSEYNPITNTGHELVIWKYNDGIALINTLDGPERGTVQWSKDGVNFEMMGRAKALPHAQGLYRGNTDSNDPLAGVSWGLSHVLNWGGPSRWGWMHINRFEVVPNK